MKKGLGILALILLINGCQSSFRFDEGPVPASVATPDPCLQTSQTSITAPSDLALWLDSQDLSTTFGSDDCVSTPLSSNGDLGCWKDKSGQGRHFIQASAANRPDFELNSFSGMNSISFTRTSADRLVNNTSALFGNSGNTLFVVMEVPLNTGEDQIIDTGSVAGAGSRRTLSIDWQDMYWSSGSYFYHHAFYGTNRVVAIVEDGANTKIIESGNSTVTTGSVSGATASGLPTVIGSRFSQNMYFIDNKIAEMIVFNKKLSDAEVTAINSHLVCKYNL